MSESDARQEAALSNRASTDRSCTKLSVVVPLFDEEGNVEALVGELAKLASRLAEQGVEFECLCVDDGSRDGTWERLSAASGQTWMRALRLSRNFGHQNALLAGLTRCTGDVVVTMDGDLQHPPELVLEMLEQWRAGFDIVNTRRDDSGQASAFKRLSSRVFYRVFSALTDVRLEPGSSDFRLVDRKVLDAILEFDDVRVFFRGAFNWVGFEAISVSYRVQPRHSGRTKYSFFKMLRFATDAIVAFSTIPLKLSIVFGFVTSLFAFLELVYVVGMYGTGKTVPGWASTIGIVSLLFGVLFVLLGIIGIYLSRIYESLQGRPRFVISESWSGSAGE